MSRLKEMRLRLGKGSPFMILTQCQHVAVNYTYEYETFLQLNPNEVVSFYASGQSSAYTSVA